MLRSSVLCCAAWSPWQLNRRPAAGQRLLREPGHRSGREQGGPVRPAGSSAETGQGAGRQIRASSDLSQIKTIH